MTTFEAIALVARLSRLSAWARRLGHLTWAAHLHERAVIVKREAWHAAWLGERRYVDKI